ncbi:unnamed protein product, partial [Oppiella nova]
MSRLNANNKQIACIKEDVKISITERLDTFLRDDSRTEIVFESSLTSNERKYIHNYCIQFSLKTRSHGFGDKRRITVWKKDNQSVANKESLSLTANSQHLVINLRQFLKQTNSLQTNRSLRGE